MLTVRGLSVNYGAIRALRGIDIDVPEGKIVTLIGANGAGKSSTLRAISGLIGGIGGSIQYDGRELSGKSPEYILAAGIAHCPEGRRVFPQLTVEENLMLGAYLRKDKPGVARDLARGYELFPRLKERSRQKAGTLSGGEQQMLALARALMSDPAIVMMDEPSLGLAPILVAEVFEVIKRIHAEGKTVLLVEQNALQALKCADYAYVLETGAITLQGTGADLLGDSRVKQAYLGG